MPKPIIMTEAMKQKAIDDFALTLNSVKMSDGKFSYSKSFNYEACSVTVWLSQEAYKKIIALVTGFTDEVGWHGTVSRVNDNPSEFVVEDIFVYPQEVTGSTVNTDQKAYTEWLYALEDDTFNKIRMQGHSHCNMGVSPSGVDDKHRQQILDMLEADMFYIFMIWNRSLSIHTLVYDMAQNVLYEDKDVEVKLLNGEDMDNFLADAQVKVTKPSNKTTAKKTKPGPKDQRTNRIGIYAGTHGHQIELDNDDYDYTGIEHYLPDSVYDRYRLGGRAWGY